MASKIQKMKVWSRIGARLAMNPTSLSAPLSDFDFLSDEETIAYLKRADRGIVRFGDGELNYISGYAAIHQHQDPGLQQKLKNILEEYDGTQNYLLALPLDLLLSDNYRERNTRPQNWHAPKYTALPFLKKHITYGSPFCFRSSDVISNNKTRYKRDVQDLFKDKNIIYVGNQRQLKTSFINPTKSVLIPGQDAYRNYDRLKTEILQKAESLKNPFVVISGGVTATVLSAELNAKGVLSYDTGSLFRT